MSKPKPPEYEDVYRRHVTERSTAEALGRTPRVTILSVIEVVFLRGAGIAPDDPVREVTAYFRADDGSPIVELDLFAKDT